VEITTLVELDLQYNFKPIGSIAYTLEDKSFGQNTYRPTHVCGH